MSANNNREGGAMTDTAETMLERMVSAMSAVPHYGEPGTEDFYNFARAAIAAMAKPDDQTLWAIADAIQGPMGGSAFDAAKDAVKAFVQAALAEQPE